MSDDELGKLAARSAELRRQIGTEQREPEAAPVSWIGDVAPALVARFQAAEQEAREHMASCTERPCARCMRYVCPCGKPCDGAQVCPACAAFNTIRGAIRPTADSIPPRFKWAIDASVQMLESRVRAPRALIVAGLERPPSTNLLLSGETGAGKTSLGVAMLCAWARADTSTRRHAMFVEAAWLSRARARHKLGQGEADLVEQCVRAPLLLLDDLGQEREDRDGCITDVVYRRSAADLPTWVTCGLAGNDLSAFVQTLSQRYDGGFVRRILETGKRVELGK